MRFKKLDLNLLVALDHMLETKSVSVAADRMFMSQSAMSNALTRLRTFFDDPLLVQVGRRMELTPRAEAMQPAIRDILVRVEATIETQPEFEPSASTRTFNILLSDYTMRVLVPHVLAIADEQGSTVKFNFLAQTDMPYALLERGEIDLLVTPDAFISAEHPSEHLFEDKFVVVSCRNGKYGTGKFNAEEYEKASHAIMVPPNNARSIEDRLLNRLGIKRQVDVTTYAFSALPFLVAGTDRIATVHESLAILAQEAVPLTIHPLPFEAEPLHQMIQWHAYRELDPGITWLRSVFRQAVGLAPFHLSHQ